jgi:hypothetical protein
MKKSSSLIAVAALATILLAGCETTATSNPVNSTQTVGNVTVNYHDQERFTDCRSDYGSFTDQGYLDILSRQFGEVGARYIQADQKLEITVSDIDLAGDFQPTRPGLDQIRIVKEIYRPRIALNFKLTGPDGKVVKEGDRVLSDSYFMSTISTIDRNEPLFYDKELISNWLRDEFKP